MTPATVTGPRHSVVIVDDEELGRLNLRYAMADHPAWQVMGEFSSAAAARAFLSQSDVDLILLDIHMPLEGGLSLARELCQQPLPPLMVFVTAYDAHAIEAFEVHALDYLLKPLNDARLASALARAETMLLQRQRAAHGDALRQYFLDADANADASANADAGPAAVAPAFWRQLNVRSVGSIERILLDEVEWIASAGNYVELHLRERTILHRIPISRLEARLDPRHFVRVHRRFIVRIDQCATLSVLSESSYALTLHSGATVAVSEPFLARVRACMGTR